MHRLLIELRDRIEEVNARASRSALGALPHEERIDCSCTQNLGMRDTRTGSVRIGHGGTYLYLGSGVGPVSTPCRRCKTLVVIGPRGEIVATLDPGQVLRGWSPGDPLPSGCLPVPVDSI